jgi:DNA-binding SARP family transcriptional activator
MGARDTVRLVGGSEPRGVRLRVRLLGGFGLERHGEPMRVGPTASRLVALVALEQRPVPRRSVACELWPEISGERSAPMLRSTLSRLDRGSSPVIDVTRGALELSPGAWVDVREVSGVARGIVERRSTRCDARDVDLVASAGELLPAWYDDWVAVARERFRQLRLHALESLCATLISEGRFGQATAAARAATRTEPLRESAHRCLIRAEAAAGHADLALADYEDFRDLLARSVGAAPSRLMEDLVQTVRKR